MKKILFGFLCIFAFNISGESLELNFDWNTASKYTFKDKTNLKKNREDFSYTVEGYSDISSGLATGWGFTLSKISVDGFSDSDVILTPLYITSKYYLSGSEAFGTFIKLHAGGYINQSFLGKTDISNPGKITIDNGYYYALGGGLQYNNFILQVMYKQFLGDASVDGNGTKFDYYTTSISIGYNSVM